MRRPVGLAGREVALHVAAGGLLGRDVDAGEGEREAVEHAGVAAAVDEAHGMIGHGGVEVPARRMASLGQVGLVVAGGADPATGGRLRGPATQTRRWMSPMDETAAGEQSTERREAA